MRTHALNCPRLSMENRARMTECVPANVKLSASRKTYMFVAFRSHPRAHSIASCPRFDRSRPPALRQRRHSISTARSSRSSSDVCVRSGPGGVRTRALANADASTLVQASTALTPPGKRVACDWRTRMGGGGLRTRFEASMQCFSRRKTSLQISDNQLFPPNLRIPAPGRVHVDGEYHCLERCEGPDDGSQSSNQKAVITGPGGYLLFSISPHMPPS